MGVLSGRRAPPQLVAGWGQVAKLYASDGAAYADFGTAVAIDADTIAVGAPQYTSYSSRPGAVYVYYRDVGGADRWGQVAKLATGTSQIGGEFGGALALDQDRLVVGANESAYTISFTKTTIPRRYVLWREVAA